VVPEDDFVGFVAEDVGRTLGMGLSIIALAALLAAFVIRQGLRVDRDAMRILERQAQLDAQSDAFGTLAAKSTLFERGRTDALAPVTEAVARSSRVRRASLWQLAHEDDVLSCVDCFDQETGGHTRGTVLRRSDHPGLFAILDAGEGVRDVEVARDARLASLHYSYLAPLGCLALLSEPVVVEGGVTGVLWLEDGRRVEWPDQIQRFARAIANLMAIRETAGIAHGAPHVIPAVELNVPAPPPVHPTEVGDIDAGLAVRRAAAFTAKLARQARETGLASAEVIDRLAVLSLRFTDAIVLAEPVTGVGNELAIAYLIEALESAAGEHGLVYLKFLTDQVVAAVDPQQDEALGAARLADFALAVQRTCDRLFAEHNAPLAFRIGMDLGPVIGTLIGRERPAFHLWGEAVQLASTLADTGLPGAVHVSESVYQVLNGRYLFQLRGRHYLEGVGEFATYLLSGRL